MTTNEETTELTLPQLIESICQKGHTGRLSVVYPGLLAFYYFRDGQLEDARAGALIGPEAVYQTMALNFGANFNFEPDVLSPVRTIDLPWQRIVLEGFCRLKQHGLNKQDETEQSNRPEPSTAIALDRALPGALAPSYLQRSAIARWPAVIAVGVLCAVAGAGSAFVLTGALGVKARKFSDSAKKDAALFGAAPTTAPASSPQPSPAPALVPVVPATATATPAEPDRTPDVAPQASQAEAAPQTAQIPAARQSAGRAQTGSDSDPAPIAEKVRNGPSGSASARVISAAAPADGDQQDEKIAQQSDAPGGITRPYAEVRLQAPPVEKKPTGAHAVTVVLKVENGRVAQAYVANRQPGMEAYEAAALRTARWLRFPDDKNSTESVTVMVNAQR
jgi:hypothetical protein